MTASQPTTNAAAFAAAQAVIPGGVDSPVRAFGSVGGTPRFMAGARGPYLTDVEGNEYVDLVCSWGPMLLGHQHPRSSRPCTPPWTAASASAPPRWRRPRWPS